MDSTIANTLIETCMIILGVLGAHWLGADWTPAATAGVGALITAIVGHYLHGNTLAKQVVAAATQTVTDTRAMFSKSISTAEQNGQQIPQTARSNP